MKLKYFLRGLGAGIIFTTIIMLSAHLMSDRSLSDDEIKDRASKLGMVMASETDAYMNYSYNNDTTTEPIKETTEVTTENPADKLTEDNTTELILEPIVEENSGSTGENSSESQKETVETTEETTEAPTEEFAEETTEDKSKVTELTIKVTAGMTSEDVSKILESNGIVDDYKKFNNYLMNKGYANRIRANSKKVNSNMTYEELAKVLVK